MDISHGWDRILSSIRGVKVHYTSRAREEREKKIDIGKEREREREKGEEEGEEKGTYANGKNS